MNQYALHRIEVICLFVQFHLEQSNNHIYFVSQKDKISLATICKSSIEFASIMPKPVSLSRCKLQRQY